MDEEINIINNNTRNEKIKNFFVNNKKFLITIVLLIITLLLGYFAFIDYKNKKRNNISDIYNSIIIEYSEENKQNSKKTLIDLVKKKDSTYSLLSLYFIIDKRLIEDKKRVNELFDIVINDTSLEIEIKNLVTYKKALFNADNIDEKQMLDILKPVINSESIWKAHALYLMAEYFYSKGEKQKSKEFFSQILVLKNNVNQDLLIEAQKRLNRDLSD